MSWHVKLGLTNISSGKTRQNFNIDKIKPIPVNEQFVDLENFQPVKICKTELFFFFAM